MVSSSIETAPGPFSCLWVPLTTKGADSTISGALLYHLPNGLHNSTKTVIHRSFSYFNPHFREPLDKYFFWHILRTPYAYPRRLDTIVAQTDREFGTLTP